MKIGSMNIFECTTKDGEVYVEKGLGDEVCIGVIGSDDRHEYDYLNPAEAIALARAILKHYNVGVA